jgi:ABC-type lipoprotein release transport system permease subunit
MNPLSPFTYYRRHKRRAVLLVMLMALAVAGLYLLVGLMQETYLTPRSTINRYLSKFSLVQPAPGTALDPALAARIRAHPDVTGVLPENNLDILVQNVGGLAFPFRLIGLQEADAAAVLARSGVTLAEGRLPQARTNGVALSREIAAALHLKVGDTFDWTKDGIAYASIVSPLEVVGILTGDVRLGIVSYEYLDSHDRFHDLARSGVLVVARPGREAAVEDYLRQTVRSPQTEIYTNRLLMDDVTKGQVMLAATFVPIVLLVTAAITLVIGAINQLAFLRRLSEFGTLYAVGRGKGWLARRLALETAGLAIAGWTLGILLAWGGMAFLSAAVYGPKGFAYAPIQAAALLLVVPLPLAVIGSTLLTAVRALGRIDVVAIVERGELSLEGERSGRAARVRTGELPRPLASMTYYRRHLRQAVLLIGTMALMIVGTALLIFILGASTDTMLQPPLTALKPMSLVSPKGLPLDPAAIAQIRAQPAVERTIPVYVFSPLDISVPPMITNYPVSAYGVGPEDMAYLMDLYGLKLAQGRLPRRGTNDIVIPWTVAQNRKIRVGDAIGGRAHPVYPNAPGLPSELVVSGIFSPAADSWLSFSSLEFVNDHPDDWKNDLSLIVVPKAGQRAALDQWLESQIAGERRTVLTYANQQAWWQAAANTLLFTISLMESIVAIVAALALAGLNYLFVAQRQAEFGALYALGFSRWQLIGRIARETLYTTGVAWLTAILGCAVILLYMQYAVYDPAGQKLNFLNPVPWLYTLPVPIAVLAVGAVTTAWILSRLDPVAMIERR